MKLCAVVDTNVFVSALLSKKEDTATVVQAFPPRCKINCSGAVFGCDRSVVNIHGADELFVLGAERPYVEALVELHAVLAAVHLA